MASSGKTLHSRSVPNSPKRSPTVVNRRRQQLQDTINNLLMELMLAQPARPLRFIEEYFSQPEDSIERHVVSLKALDPLRISNGFIFHKIFQSLCPSGVGYLRYEVLVDLVDRCLADCDFSLGDMLNSRPLFHGHAINFRTFRLVLTECLSYRLLKNFVDDLEPCPSNETLWTSVEEVVPPNHKAELRELVLSPPAASHLLPRQLAELYRTVILEVHLDALLVDGETF